MIEISPLTTSPDEAAAIEQVNAIYDYVRGQRVMVGRFPAALPIIQGFEAWYQGLEESTKTGLPNVLPGIGTQHTVNQADVNEAERRKATLNDAIGQKLPDDQAPADGSQTAPQGADYEKGRDQPDNIKTAITLGALLAGGFVLYKLFS